MYEYTYTYDNNNIFFAYNIILPLFFIFFFKYLIQCNYNIKHDNKIIHLFYQKFNWFLIKFIDIIILYMFIWYSATTYIISLFCYYANIYLSFLIFLYFLVKIDQFCSVKFNFNNFYYWLLYDDGFILYTTIIVDLLPFIPLFQNSILIFWWISHLLRPLHPLSWTLPYSSSMTKNCIRLFCFFWL